MNKVSGIQHILSVSDLHLEFYGDEALWSRVLPTPDKNALLILAGDILIWKYGGKFKFNSPIVRLLTKLSSEFGAVVYVPGNHEYYRGIAGNYYDNKLRDFIKQAELSNVFFLNNDSLIVNNTVKIVGSTLWTDMRSPNDPSFEFRVSRAYNQGKSPLNDFNYIRFSDDKRTFPLLNLRSVLLLHQRSVRFLEKELAKDFDGEVFVVTHHLPSLLLIDDKYLGHYLTPAYASSVEYLSEGVSKWFYGHSHQVAEKRIRGLDTLFISNASGYKHQIDKQFDANKIFYTFG